jgi:arylsulfatase A-like enzyme
VAPAVYHNLNRVETPDDPSYHFMNDMSTKAIEWVRFQQALTPDKPFFVYFGAEMPEGKSKNWIKTDPAKGFFVVFRFYGPLEGYIEKTWVLNDFEEIE